MSDDLTANELRKLVSELATQLAQTQSELEHLQGSIRPRPFGRTKRWALSTGVAIGLAVLVGARLVVADSPPLTGEVVPRQIPYRGYLEENGSPKTGQLDMTFELYADSTSNSPLWSESRSVAVVDGAFSVDLGDCTTTTSCPKGSLAAALATSPPSLYLAIKVAGNALSGRQRLMSNAYALRAEISASSTEAKHALAADSAANATHATSADSATTATHATSADSAANSTNATSANHASSVDIVAQMTSSSDAFNNECTSTWNAQMCGVLAHRKCSALGYTTGFFVGESCNGTSALVMCLR